MNKILMVLLALCAGGIGFNSLSRSAGQHRAVAVLDEQQQLAAMNVLADLESLAATLRAKVQEQAHRLRQAQRHPEISDELLMLLEGDMSENHPAAWAELRQQLDIGWDSSSEYVLVSKRVLKQLDYQRFLSAVRASDETIDLLALSSSEQSAIRAALDHARAAQWTRLTRTEPSGDIVAQYTVPAPDPDLELNMSNAFAAELHAAVGPERLELLLPEAWRQLRYEMAPLEQETMTIRWTVMDGEPDLVCEIDDRGKVVSTFPVRYAHYPTKWFMPLFPGGWEPFAAREGFELPPHFKK